MPLLWRVFLPSAAVLAFAAVALIVLPVSVSRQTLPPEMLLISGALVVLLVANLLLVRHSLASVRDLVVLARGVDALEPGERLESPGPGEVDEVVRGFNRVLARLEAERADAAGRTLRAQEEERLRLAHELHDEVGQTFTAVLLQLGRASQTAPPELRPRLQAAQEAARAGIDEVGRIVHRLRPEALDDLGLPSALTALGAAVTRQTGVEVHRTIAPDVPALSPEAELVMYRVAQEALTNVARHSGAHDAWLSLDNGDGRVVLTVRDDGRGLPDEEARPGGAGGIRGMHERALLVHGALEVAALPEGGTRVRLEVPVAPARAA